MAAARGRIRGERGVILVQVALSLLVLMGFAVFVCDYGVVLVSRGQAQNAADAGALAGAVAFAYNEFGDAPSLTGHTKRTADGLAATNFVWGERNVPGGGVVVETPPCPSNARVPGSSDCVRVNVYRNGEAGSSPLPVFFAPILGITSQGVRATATAEAAAANAVQCLKPWAVADGWLESSPGAPSTYSQAAGDVYRAPYAADGTGFKYKQGDVPVDYGRQVVLKHSDMTQPPGSPLTAGFAVAVDLPNDGPRYSNNVLGCTSATVAIAPGVSAGCAAGSSNPAAGCLAVTAPNDHAALMQSFAAALRDASNATWDPLLDDGRGSISGGPAATNRRIVPVAVFDPVRFVNDGTVVKVVNVVGLFIEGLCGDGFDKETYVDCSNPQDIVGRLVRFPGTFGDADTFDPSSTVDPSSSFGVVIRLVR